MGDLLVGFLAISGAGAWAVIGILAVLLWTVSEPDYDDRCSLCGQRYPPLWEADHEG